MTQEIANTYTYILTQSACTEPSGGATVYGIALNHDTEYLPNVQTRFSDLGTDRRQIQTLVDLCNELQLHPIHLVDVAEDFLFSGLCPLGNTRESAQNQKENLGKERRKDSVSGSTERQTEFQT